MKISPVEPPRGTDAPLVLWGRFGRFAQAPWTRLRISAAGLPYPGLPVTGKIDELDHPRCLYNLSRLSRLSHAVEAGWTQGSVTCAVDLI